MVEIIKSKNRMWYSNMIGTTWIVLKIYKDCILVRDNKKMLNIINHGDYIYL